MFEKESEEYTFFVKSTKERWNCHEIFYADIELAHQKGAEFGYNKANEWHNIKENPNELPNDGELVLADNIFTTECVKFKKEKDGNHWKHDDFELCNVVYWKEIVLPKLKEIKEND